MKHQQPKRRRPLLSVLLFFAIGFAAGMYRREIVSFAQGQIEAMQK